MPLVLDHCLVCAMCTYKPLTRVISLDPDIAGFCKENFRISDKFEEDAKISHRTDFSLIIFVSSCSSKRVYRKFHLHDANNEDIEVNA